VQFAVTRWRLVDVCPEYF